jgi:catechol 2,3-dioxygenase-like lactoylglutathione lyase family enzyme
MTIELNRQTSAPVSPPGGFRGVVPPGEQSTPVTLDNHVTEAAFGRIRDAGISYYADPACRQAGQVYTSKNGNRGTYFRDPDGHLMEILTVTAGAPS